jgi:hypothetical protein
MEIGSMGSILSLVSLDKLVDLGVDLSLEGGGVEGGSRPASTALQLPY